MVEFFEDKGKLGVKIFAQRKIPFDLTFKLLFKKSSIILFTVAAHLRAAAMNPKSDFFTREFTK